MISLDMNTDVLAIKCIKNYVFIGIGCTIYVLNNIRCKLEIKINVLHPDNIYDIINKSDDKLIVYGKKSLCILSISFRDDFIRIEQIDEIIRFDDWIINVKWLGALSDPTLTILFANNNVYNFELFSKQYFNTHCKERCLLYSGTIFGQSCKNTLIFSGTVFQEILIWRVMHNSNMKFSEVLHRLIGHKGVIFSVLYNPLNNLICSTSDDRTVRLWKISSTLINDLNNAVWKNIEITLQTTMYGHIARVWKAIFLKNIIASIGEDSRICFWTLLGVLLYKIEAHHGAPIWCIDISEDNIVFTGGGDGSVNSWPLKNINPLQNHVLLEINNHMLPKHIHIINRIKNKWYHIGKYKIEDSKIFSIKWLNIDTILVCVAEGHLYIIQFLKFSIKILSEHVLPTSRQRWVTSACVYNNLLVCGDRIGSIYVYNLQNNEKYPVQSFRKIHGQFGVQSCIIMNCNLITTGRDRTLKFYKFCDISGHNPTIEFLHAKTMPMDWVSKLIKHKNYYYVLGFKEKEFIIYNLSLKRIVSKILCGGGHRSWDCVMYNKLTNFAYIQKKQVYIVTISLDTLYNPPLLNAFHTKQINCIKILHILSKHHYILISGGEDCTLFISSIIPKSQSRVKFIDFFNGHLSSIKCISIFTVLIDKNISKHLIFSGGGRAQLKLWEITIKTNTANNNTLSNENISCKDLLSYMLHGLDKKRNKIWVGNELIYNTDTETRYMDISTINNPQNMDNILVFIACSDGCLRSFSYSIQTNQIKLINTLMNKNRCILKVHITMATDGLLNIWNVISTNDIFEIKNVTIDGKHDLSLHQSGINSFDIKILNNYEYILATGGDDNLLNLLIFKIIFQHNEVLSIHVVSSWGTISIHSAQITGIILLHNRIISVGRDQKLAVHKYSYNNSKICAMFLKEINLCISDVQGIILCVNQKPNTHLFCVYGKGFQLLEV
ncbi:PREDICTED: WD repeat-containing protein 6 [Ceratosolen solmsi marchali]|uniref:tRNA (34-2'-O)-methyltransferase regulator WDR6 n=1 Tax=Ceratosolen solmsi marchali TaxID=326594 RepID=A0AAJ7DZX4_9HYME|nr:PREDICTED: WD repeat-containing protein 6 [Ceratosolen solmsi marchali]